MWCKVLLFLLLTVILTLAAPIQQGATLDATGSPPTSPSSTLASILFEPENFVLYVSASAAATPLWAPEKHGYENPQKTTDRIGKWIAVTFVILIGVGLLGGAIVQISMRACGRGRQLSTDQGFSRMSTGSSNSSPVKPCDTASQTSTRCSCARLSVS